MEVNKVIEALEKHGSKRATLVELGYANNNSTALKKLSKIIKDNNLEYLLVFKNNARKGNDWSEDNLRKAVSESNTYSEVLVKLNVVPRGRNIELLKIKLSKFNINIDHFDRYIKHYKKHDEVFVISKDITIVTVKKHFLKLVEYKCSNAKCNLSEWYGNPIKLEMDHINGINYDHRLENLRLLCPNCHSQTETYCKGNK